MGDLFILAIPLFPLVAFLVNALAGRWIKEIGGWIAVIAMMMSALVSTVMFIGVWRDAEAMNIPIQTTLWEWIAVGELHITAGFHFDELTAVMCFVVTFVGSLVFLYSIGYMHGDPGFSRFFSYLCLFAFSMLILVLADSLPLLLVGWEGVGLCSYLLIGYYLSMKGAPEAGKKAFIVNRVGDFGYILAMFMIYKHTGTLNISEIVKMAPETFAAGGAAITGITLLLLLGCTGKSAQIPLFVWLPDAMAGPTPVSALIHAATMVTAGVYLVVRTSVLFALAPDTMAVMAIIGAATAFVAGTTALTQRDIKKVLAYSTVSQLGFMFLACGVGAFAAGIFHVLTHAFFKACLFLGAGAVIHAIDGTQDLFLMGGLRHKLKWTWFTFFAASLAISGFPLTAGFFSKDEILWKTFSISPESLRIFGVPILYFIALLTAFLTAIYSFRALILAFHGESRLPESIRKHIHAPNWTMVLPLLVLAIGSLTVGFMNVPHALAGPMGLGEGAAFEHMLSPVTSGAEEIMHANVEEPEHHAASLEIGLTVLSVIIGLAGIAAAVYFFRQTWPNASGRLAARFYPLYQLSRGAWWLDIAYNAVFGAGTRFLGRFAVWIDNWIIDGILHFMSKFARELSRLVRRFQMGQVQAYALVILLGANLLLLVILLW